MCGFVAPVLGTVASLFGGGKSQGVQSYNPQEHDVEAVLPDPMTQDPQLGVDNSNKPQSSQGKSALTNPLKRDPSLATPGGRGTGVNVVGR